MASYDIKQAIYDKYIVPTIGNHGDKIGVELEIPILNRKPGAVDFAFIQQFAQVIQTQFGFQVAGRDDHGAVYSMVHPTNRDCISFDYSYCNVEFSMGAENDIGIIYDRFCMYYKYLQGFLQEHNYTMTGMGVNPYWRYNDNNALPGQRYRMIQYHLESYVEHKEFRKFHSQPNFGSYSCASQVQLDVSDDQLIRALNTFNRLEPIKALLFANSLLLDDEFNLVSARDRFWDSSMYGYNPHNVGMFDVELTDIPELVEYIKGTSLFNVARDGKYIYFTPIPASQFFDLQTVNGMVFDPNKEHFVPVEVCPQPSDLQYLRSYKFEDLTFRGTIEYRSACCQPIRECMTVAAFHVGLMQQLNELETLLKEDRSLYKQGYSPCELRKMLIQLELPRELNPDALRQITVQVLTLAEKGLKQRGKGEERFLQPLFRRAETLTNPAREILHREKYGKTMEELIDEYASL